MPDPTGELELSAIDLRSSGAFERAAALFAASADAAGDDTRRRLDMRIRQACCLVMIDRSTDAFEIAADVARAARAEGHLVELADALGVMVDHHVRVGQIAEGAQVLSEALDVLSQVPATAAAYALTHNLAASLEHSGFLGESVDLFRRAMDLATDPADAQFTAASMVSAHHYAAVRSVDADERERLIAEGIVLLESLDVERGEVHATVSAQAHGAMLLALAGRWDEARRLGLTAAARASELDLGEEQVVAEGAALVAAWNLTHDAGMLLAVEGALARAADLNRLEEFCALQATQVEMLWALGRTDEAREVLERRIAQSAARLAAERRVRWDHVQLGVEHRRVALLSESDPLTGLHNRRSLERMLPELLAGRHSLVVGLVDLDGFKQVNDQLGYAQGDSVIREAADLLEGMCRRGDLVVRLGGDEFVMVLRDTDEQGAFRVFERIRALLDGHRYVGLPDSIRVSASIGVLVISADETREIREVLASAATAMQISKKAGKNRVTLVTTTTGDPDPAEGLHLS